MPWFSLTWVKASSEEPGSPKDDQVTLNKRRSGTYYEKNNRDR